VGRAGVSILVLAAAVACGNLGDLGAVLALEVAAPDSLEEYDTLRPRARALNGHGDSVRAAILWSTLDTAVLTLLDSTTGKAIVRSVGATPGRLLARTEGVISNVIAIRPLAAADTLFAAGPTALTPRQADSLSDSLKVELADTVAAVTGGGSLTVPLAGRPITYTIVYPVTAGPVTLVARDTSHGLVASASVATGISGIAFVKVRLLGPVAPDSVVVTAGARRALGTTVPGSPVTFTVRFVP
jgi:hypothetical protein